ncbi:hypothetical protein OGAPHI_001545 [Ogataea philodendri]|uniref:Uncharacterized protein n=1 Tax=Ogataea philodendri TaxID=1378263 RepID=A0A9P8T8E0_9ASCO|nr:uncharacterized protein OGAPHI_001545 [Ogataea philodendri]KAH3669424.1 hypothetical protein OGAPHI_001545 [Ogataea philodendri]
MIGNHFVFKRVLLTILFSFFASLLIYTDYLQELYLFSNKFRLTEFKVDMETYHFLKEYSDLEQQSVTPLKLAKDIESPVNEFYMDSPFPKLDLVYVGPTFIENGSIALNCEYSFTKFKCRVQGLIRSEKTYLANTYLNDSKFEEIEFKTSYHALLQFYKLRHLATTNNQSNLRLITNYLFLFGFNGTNIPLFSSPTEEVDLSVIDRKIENYNKIQNCVKDLLVLVQLKIVNFALIGVSFVSVLFLHLVLYWLLYLVCGGSSRSRANRGPDPNERDIVVPDYVMHSSSTIHFDTTAKPEHDTDYSGLEEQKDEYQDFRNQDLLGKSRFAFGLIIVYCLVHYLVYYLIDFLVQQAINRIFWNITNGEIELTGISSTNTLTASAGFPDTSSSLPETNWNSNGGETFTTLLNICGLVLNTLIFSFFHYLYGILVYVYTLT